MADQFLQPILTSSILLCYNVADASQGIKSTLKPFVMYFIGKYWGIYLARKFKIIGMSLMCPKVCSANKVPGPLGVQGSIWFSALT